MTLTPAQQEVLEVLRGDRDSRPTVDPGLRDELRFMLEEPLASVTADLADDVRLVLGKTHLSQVLACESYHLAEQEAGFAWTVRAAKGTVAHKAIELSVHLRGEPTPLDLVDHALDSLADADDSRSIGAFLSQVGDVERAELRSEAADMVSRFVELWPPLRKAWVPCTESSVSAELCGGRILLRGKVDLTLGRPVGLTAGRLVIDLKSSGHRPGHIDDLRLYALLDTLRTGVPPFRIAGYALDAGTFHAEDVTFGVLEAAVRRTVAGVTKIVELRRGEREPTETPGPACSWCPRRDDCDGPAAWEASRAPA